MARMFLNSFKLISNSILGYIFDLKQVENVSDAKHWRELYFRKISEIAIRNLASLHIYFQQNVNADVCVNIFEGFKPDTDYNCECFKVISRHYKMIDHFLLRFILFCLFLVQFYS